MVKLMVMLPITNYISLQMFKRIIFKSGYRVSSRFMSKYFVYIQFFWITLLPGSLKGQVKNQFFYEKNTIDSALNKSLRFGIDLLGFQKNNEYFNDFLD